jgi:hypothetical protein
MHSLPATRNTTGADPHTVSGVCLSVDGVPTFLLPWRQRLQGGLTRLRDFSSSCIAPSSAVVPCTQSRCMDTQRIQLHTLHSASVPVNIPYIRKPLFCGQAPRATAQVGLENMRSYDETIQIYLVSYHCTRLCCAFVNLSCSQSVALRNQLMILTIPSCDSVMRLCSNPIYRFVMVHSLQQPSLSGNN